VVVLKWYFKLVQDFLVDLPSPANLNYIYGFGFILGIVYVVQIFSGVILSLFFRVGDTGSFWRVIYIIQDVRRG